MKRRYLLHRDSENKLIEFKFWGDWTLQEYLVFEKEFRDAVDPMHKQYESFSVLADLSDFPAQSLEIQTKLAENMGYAVKNGLIKSARYFKSMLNKKQLRQLAKQVDPKKFGQFNTREEARQWLFES